MSTLISSKHKCAINFLNKVHPRYFCGVCSHVADEPLSCGSKDGCTGVFCSKCLTASVVESSKCPSCSFEIADSPHKNNFAKEIIADEPVYCTYAELTNDVNKDSDDEITSWSACTWTGALKDLEAHIATDCELAPVPCTHPGCTVAPPRSQLSLHLTNECELRNILCLHCCEPVVFIDMPCHLEACGKVSLTCTNCQAPYLREDQAAHHACCPEKPVTCPFACHGCAVALVRKDYDQHQIDGAVSHAELLAGKLSAVDKLMADMTVEFTNLKKSITDNCISPIAKLSTEVSTFKLDVASAKESLTTNDKKQTKLITDITKKQSTLEQSVLVQSMNNLLGEKPKTETVNLTWVADKITASGTIATNSTIRSKDFIIGTGTTSSTLYLLGSFTSAKFSIYIYKDCDKSKNKNSTVIKELDITLQHPSDTTKHLTIKCSESTLSQTQYYAGWVLTNDVKPYICIALGSSITLKCKVKYQIDPVDIAI